MLRDSLSYPVRGNGWIMLLTGTVFAVLLGLLQSIPRVGLLVALVTVGYFAAFYFDIVGTTINDREEVPDWPSFTSFAEDILSPFLQVMGVLLLSFGPFTVLRFVPDSEALWYLPAQIGAFAYGCGYFPMAVLATCVAGGLGGALPHIVIPAIVRSRRSYWLAVAVLMIGGTAYSGIQILGSRVVAFGWFFTSVIGLYGLMAQGRLIGLIYREQRDRLGWE